MPGRVTIIVHSNRLTTFRTLCKRYGLRYSTLWVRYQKGDRGARLVRPTEAKYGHRGQWGIDEARV
jgi:hypothetical protein